MNKTAANFIDPVALMRIKSLELRAKAVVEGFQSGLNRSPYHGFSVEFTEYREYSPGDDPRYLDWKAYARSDRHYIRKFEDETNLCCHLLLDMSRSMEFGSGEYTKADYARTLAATLAYFLNTQRDAVGLFTFDDGLDAVIPARYRVGHLRRIFVALERQPAGTATEILRPLEHAAEVIRRRGMIVLVSDLLTSIDGLDQKLSFLRARGHEVAVFQVLDAAEIDFNFDQAALFEDAETGREIYVDPEKARDGYQAKLSAHLEAIRAVCDARGIEYRMFRTDQSLDQALFEFLRFRMNVKASPVRSRTNAPRKAGA